MATLFDPALHILPHLRGTTRPRSNSTAAHDLNTTTPSSSAPKPGAISSDRAMAQMARSTHESSALQQMRLNESGKRLQIRQASADAIRRFVCEARDDAGTSSTHEKLSRPACSQLGRLAQRRAPCAKSLGSRGLLGLGLLGGAHGGLALVPAVDGVLAVDLVEPLAVSLVGLGSSSTAATASTTTPPAPATKPAESRLRMHRRKGWRSKRRHCGCGGKNREAGRQREESLGHGTQGDFRVMVITLRNWRAMTSLRWRFSFLRLRRQLMLTPCMFSATSESEDPATMADLHAACVQSGRCASNLEAPHALGITVQAGEHARR